MRTLSLMAGGWAVQVLCGVACFGQLLAGPARWVACCCASAGCCRARAVGAQEGSNKDCGEHVKTTACAANARACPSLFDLAWLSLAACLESLSFVSVLKGCPPVGAYWGPVEVVVAHICCLIQIARPLPCTSCACPKLSLGGSGASISRSSWPCKGGGCLSSLQDQAKA